MLEELSDDALHGLAGDMGLDAGANEARDSLIARVRARQELIAGVSREELAGILRWAGEEVEDSQAKDVLVRGFYRVSFRKTAGLSPGNLRVAARMHGMEFDDGTPPEELARRIERASRRWTDTLKRTGGRVAGFIASRAAGGREREDVRDEEDRRGIVSNTIKKGVKAALRFSMDDYIKDKLDEIEVRIDRKLDDIDRRMNEWRTREVRHRLRIIRYTIIATVVVAVISIIYKLIAR